MYLGCSFIYKEFNLEEPDHKGGSDLTVVYDNTKILVEAVTPKKGDGDDKLERPPNGEFVKILEEKIILRIQNSIDLKKKNYLHWLHEKKVNGNEPFILAINCSELPSARTDRPLPLIIRAVSQFGCQYITFNKENFDVIEQGYHYEDSVRKSSGTVIRKNIIANEEYNFISAFLYSCADPFNYPKYLGDDFILIHNPLAKNKLPIGFLNLGYEYYREENQLKKNDYIINKVN